MPESDLPALVARAQQGDRPAFEKIVRLTARLVFAQIAASLRDRQRAEDLTQDTFLAAWKALGTVQTPTGFITWLLTLARNKTLDALKFDHRQKRSQVVPAPVVPTPSSASRHSDGSSRPIDPADTPDDGPSPAQAAQHAEARDHALRILEELPDEYRRPLAMRYLAGADYHTIRRALDLTDGALRGLLTRGMALLRERMSRLNDDKVKR